MHAQGPAVPLPQAALAPDLLGPQPTAGETRTLPLEVLLVEDDLGDALLVEELLADGDQPVVLTHVTTMAACREALLRLHFDCVLMDLGLPDTEGLSGVHAVLSAAPDVAVVVLTGLTDGGRGNAAVAAGAQDYLVKGQVDGMLLGRALRYAAERRRAEESLRRLHTSQVQAAEYRRLERGLLPSPLVARADRRVCAGYRPGRDQSLLGGDFYDVVERADGSLVAVIGDVAGHGPDEAALGVALRIAWRTLVLSDVPDEDVLPALERVLIAERRTAETFTTLAQTVVAPDFSAARLWLAGHPPPLLLDPTGRRPPVLAAGDPGGPALGVVAGSGVEPAAVALGGAALMFYTDGLIEGWEAPGSTTRLGTDGLVATVAGTTGVPLTELADAVIAAVEARNGDRMADDVALLVLWPDRPGAA